MVGEPAPTSPEFWNDLFHFFNDCRFVRSPFLQDGYQYNFPAINYLFTYFAKFSRLFRMGSKVIFQPQATLPDKMI